jgi:hypothetical protein
MWPKALGRDDSEGAADIWHGPEASEVKSIGVFWLEPIFINDIDDNKLW